VLCTKCGKDNPPEAEFCNFCGSLMANVIRPKTWKPKAGGIINIVIGSFYLLLFGLPIVITAIQGGDNWREFGSLMAGIFIILGPVSVMAIIGGIFALKRRKWVLAMIGSVCAIFSPFLIGLAALIFIVISRNEFEVKKLPPTSIQK
jgi:hypothetical protein